MLADRGVATTEEIAATLLSDLPDDARTHELAQAAQILVNRAEIEAHAVLGPDATIQKSAVS